MANPNKGNLDPSQIFNAAFDATSERLRVDAEVTANVGIAELVIDAPGDNIAISDGVNMLGITSDGEAKISITKPLPTGTNSIGTVTQAGPWNINLPTNAATASNQATVITSLSSVDTKITADFEDFGAASNLAASISSAYTYTNSKGMNTITFYLTIPTGGTVMFESTVDGINWTGCTLRQKSGDNYIQSATTNGEFIGSISAARSFRVRVTSIGSAPGSVIGRAGKQVSTLEGIENGPPDEFYFNVARGKIGGVDGARRFARNPDIDTTRETIWPLGGIYVWPTNPSTWYISSSSASDAGRTIQMTVLDANFVSTTRTITLAGQTKTAITGGEIFRLISAFNSGAVDLVGNVYIYEDDTVVAGVPATPAKVKAYITNTEQNSGLGFYTIPAGKTGYLTGWAATSSTGVSDVTLDIKNFGQVWRQRGRRLVNGDTEIQYTVFLRIPEKSDLRFEASTSVNNVSVLIDYDLILVDN